MTNQNVYSGTSIEAKLIVNFLKGQGVRAYIDTPTMNSVNSYLSSVYGQGGDSSVNVLVSPIDHKKATQLLETRKNIPAAPEWVCQNCSEKIEGQFTTCWKCGVSQY